MNVVNAREAHILLVEDDENLGSILRDYLQMSGYDVEWIRYAQGFAPKISRSTYDLILLDIHLPDGSGFDLLRSLRASCNSLVFVVSGEKDEASRLRAYEEGADDFVSKPYSAKELTLKIRNTLQRFGTQTISSQAADRTQLGDWTLNMQRHELVHPSGHIEVLARGEFELLSILLEHRGELVERERLESTIRQRYRPMRTETITSLIYRLRKKLQSIDGSCPIKTIPSSGYCLE